VHLDSFREALHDWVPVGLHNLRFSYEGMGYYEMIALRAYVLTYVRTGTSTLGRNALKCERVLARSLLIGFLDFDAELDLG
jgi:hypothetical protein